MPNINLNFFWSSNFLLVGGQLNGGRCIYLVVCWSAVGWLVGWLVGRLSMVDGRLVGGFKKTRNRDNHGQEKFFTRFANNLQLWLRVLRIPSLLIITRHLD